MGRKVTREKRQRGQRAQRSRMPNIEDGVAPVPVCTCGHVDDEHDGSTCAVEGCPCVQYERDLNL